MDLMYRQGTLAYLATLAPAPKRELRAVLRRLQEDPRHPDLDLKQMRKRADFLYYRVRVGDYRVVFSLRGRTVHVWRIMHRSEGYDWLDHFDP